jgi:hypothetical protein
MFKLILNTLIIHFKLYCSWIISHLFKDYFYEFRLKLYDIFYLVD